MRHCSIFRKNKGLDRIMKRLAKYLKGYKKEICLGPLLKLLEASLELLVPLVVSRIIDVGIPAADKGYILKMALLMVLLGLLGLGCTVLAQYYSAKASVGFASELRHSVFAHIQRFDYKTLDTVGQATLITRMTGDINQIQTGLNLALRLLLRSPFVVFGAMVMAFTIDVGSALIFAVAIPVLAVVVFGIMLSCIPLYKKVQHALDGVLLTAKENLAGARVIRAFGREKAEEDRFDGESKILLGLQKLVGRISALLNPITLVLINFATLVLIVGGGRGVNDGTLTQGQVIALYNYMSQILVELIKLADLIINITKSLACADRVADLLDIPAGEDIVRGLPEGDKNAKIEFKNVSLCYGGAGADSLTDISFKAAAGESIGIIGGTGSGKSSIVNLIPRFYTATDGSVYFDGTDVRGIDAGSLRSRIGIVPQKAKLFKGTVRENLCFGRDASDEQIYTALKAAQALDVVKSKGGLDAEIEQDGRNLSGGQRQRLTIARALVGRPEVLILDDSASALDFATDAALRKALRELDFKTTVFIVSQRTSSVAHCDKIIVLDDGRAVGIGTHDALLASCDVYREIYDSQFKKEGVK